MGSETKADAMHLDLAHDGAGAEPYPETPSALIARQAGDGLHRIVVVGGGAEGLELVTRLGDRLGRRRCAEITLVNCARTHL